MRSQLEQGCLRRRLGGIEHGNGNGGGRGLVAGSRVGRGVAGWSRGRGLVTGSQVGSRDSRVRSQFGTDLLLSKLT